MKKKWHLLYVAIATALLLAACGTSDIGTNGKTENPVSTVEDTGIAGET